MPPPLPPGFVLQQPAAAPAQGHPPLSPGFAVQRPPAIIAGPPRQPPPQSPVQDEIDRQRLITARHNNEQADSALDPQTVDMLAHQYIMSGTMPPMGMGRSATQSRQAVLNRAAEVARVQGRDGASLSAGFARYRNGVSALRTQENQLGTLRGSEQTALANALQYIDRSSELSLQTRIPLINSVTQSYLRNTGDPTVTSMDAAFQTFATEYARLIAGTPTGGGTLSDSARQEAMNILRGNYSVEQKRSAVEQMRIDMHNRIEALNNNIAEGYRNLEAGQITSSGAHQQAPPPPGGYTVDDVRGAVAAARAGQPPDQSPTGAPPSGPQPPGDGETMPGGDPNTLVVDIAGGHFPTSEADAGPDWRAAYQQARQQDPSLTFPAFVQQSRMHGSNAPPDISAERGPNADPNGNSLQDSIINIANPWAGAAREAVGLFGGHEAGQAFQRGALDMFSIGMADPVAAASNTLFGSGTYADNLARQDAITAFDVDNHPFARLGGQVAAGLALPGGAVETLPGRMAVGAGYGAGYGFNTTRGPWSQHVENALVGGGIGAAVPAALTAGGRVVNALRRDAPAVSPEAQAIAQAGEAEQVPLSRPIVDPTARNRMMTLESQVGGHGPVREGLEATATGIENAVSRLAGEGTANERGAMGARIQQAAQNYVAQSGRRIGAIYNRAADMARGVPVLAGTAVQRLDQHLAELRQNAGQNADVIHFLQTVRGDLVDENGILRPKTVAAIRDMRTALRGNIDHASLTHTNAERIMSDVLDGASQDVDHFLGAANPQANRLYQQADRAWRARHEEITQVVDRLVGRADNPAGGGQVMNNVSGLIAGDVPRLRRVMGMLSPAERADLRATVAARAGYKSPDEPFSLPQFIAWQRSIPESARQAVFGEEGAQSIRNLTLLSRALIDTRGALNNSRSGAARNAAAFWQSTLGGFVPSGMAGLVTGSGFTSTAVAGGALSAGVGAALAAVRRLSARALMSPDMSRWLALAPRQTTAGAIRTHIGVLSGIAARNPAIAQETLGLRQALLNAANDNWGQVTRSAASTGNNEEGGQNERR